MSCAGCGNACLAVTDCEAPFSPKAMSCGWQPSCGAGHTVYTSAFAGQKHRLSTPQLPSDLLHFERCQRCCSPGPAAHAVRVMLFFFCVIKCKVLGQAACLNLQKVHVHLHDIQRQHLCCLGAARQAGQAGHCAPAVSMHELLDVCAGLRCAAPSHTLSVHLLAQLGCRMQTAGQA